MRVSSLTLLGALVSAQAPLQEMWLLLQQPGLSEGPSASRGETPQEPSFIWRQSSHRENDTSLPLSGAGVQAFPEAPCWLLQLCVTLVTHPHEEPCSDSDAVGSAGGSLEPSPVRLEALQVREENSDQSLKRTKLSYYLPSQDNSCLMFV